MPLLVAHGFPDCLAEHDAYVLDRMVRVDVEVAAGFDVQIEATVAGDLIEHVLEERQAGRDSRAPAAVDVDRDGDGRL